MSNKKGRNRGERWAAGVRRNASQRQKAEKPTHVLIWALYLVAGTKCNLDLLRQHYEAVFSGTTKDDGMVCLSSANQRGIWKQFDFIDPSNIDQLVSLTVLRSNKFNCYQSVNFVDPAAVPAIQKRRGRGRENELLSVVALGLDADAGGKEGHNYPPQSILLEALAAMPLQPSIVNLTGRADGGVHCWWLLDRPFIISDPGQRVRVKEISEAWKNLLKLLLGGYDLDSTHDLSRVLRPAGSINHKYGSIVEPLTFEPTRRYTINQFQAALPEPPKPDAGQAHHAFAVRWHASRKPSGVLATSPVEQARRYLSGVPGAVSGQSGHDRTFRAACILVRGFALSIEDALPILEDWNRTCEPPWSTSELLHELGGAYRANGPTGNLIRSAADEKADPKKRRNSLRDWQKEVSPYVHLLLDVNSTMPPKGMAGCGKVDRYAVEERQSYIGYLSTLPQLTATLGGCFDDFAPEIDPESRKQRILATLKKYERHRERRWDSDTKCQHPFPVVGRKDGGPAYILTPCKRHACNACRLRWERSTWEKAQTILAQHEGKIYCWTIAEAAFPQARKTLHKRGGKPLNYFALTQDGGLIRVLADQPCCPNQHEESIAGAKLFLLREAIVSAKYAEQSTRDGKVTRERILRISRAWAALARPDDEEKSFRRIKGPKVSLAAFIDVLEAHKRPEPDPQFWERSGIIFRGSQGLFICRVKCEKCRTCPDCDALKQTTGKLCPYCARRCEECTDRREREFWSKVESKSVMAAMGKQTQKWKQKMEAAQKAREAREAAGQDETLDDF